MAKKNFKKIVDDATKDKYNNPRHQSLFCRSDEHTEKFDKEKCFDDPFLNFGSGIVAYRGLLRGLITVFFIMTILMVPVVMIYGDDKEN
jgi:hypothetical protein